MGVGWVQDEVSGVVCLSLCMGVHVTGEGELATKKAAAAQLILRNLVCAGAWAAPLMKADMPYFCDRKIPEMCMPRMLEMEGYQRGFDE